MGCSKCPTIPCTCNKNKKACCTSCIYGKKCESENKSTVVKNNNITRNINQRNNPRNIEKKIGGKGRIVKNTVCLSCSSNKRYIHRTFSRNKNINRER